MTGAATTTSANFEARASLGARRRVICHMLASIDGRIVVDDWPLSEAARRQ